MTWSESSIARAISTQLLNKRCVVLVDNCNWTGYECDVLCVTTDLRIIDVEVKISRADLKADAKKDKWWRRDGSFLWHQEGPPAPELPRAHPPRVWKHYYALPKSIWKPELLECLPSASSGVLLLHNLDDGLVGISCERRASPDRHADCLSPQQAIDVARLASIRMWEMGGKLEAARSAKNHG